MFGDKLKRLREANNLSQQQLAEKLGMSPSGIGMYVWRQIKKA
nr:MAG TPA: helix-turn-helix domain protein [Caudoviricetes sp.]